MAPLIDVPNPEDHKKLIRVADALDMSYSVPEPQNPEAPNVIIPGKNGFIYVPSLNLDVARERTYHNLNLSQAHSALAEEDARMLTMLEFREFLIYTRENHPEVYEDITAVRNPWRAEWIDAAFEKREDGLYVLTGNKSYAEKLSEDTLMKDKTPGISLDSWLSYEATAQGFPSKGVGNGNSWYWHPRDGAVAWFSAFSDRSNLDCGRDPADRGQNLGVRAAKPRG